MLFSSDTEQITVATRLALGVLVSREQNRTGSRTVAYQNVASLVGASSSWVQKFLRDSGEVREPRMPLFLNIRAAYDRLCDRVEKENAADEVRLRNLKGRIDALAEGIASQSYAQTNSISDAD